ncbi:MAG: hypothetical protein GY850_06455 [bacterium]|nr:hypothetical protein [bacterium]
MPENEELFYRSIPIRRGQVPATVNDSERSVAVVVATETPTQVFDDFERLEIVSEVLLMSGVQLPESRQVVLLDSHQRFDSASVIGSVRELAVSGGKLTGRSFFSSEPEGSGPFQKVKENHLTDFSVGYRVSESEWIPEGEKTTYKGKVYEGPLRLATAWTLKEVSIVPIGADELAKARSVINSQGNQGKDKDMLTKEEIEKIRTEERERVAEITAMTKRFNVDDMAENLINKGSSVDTARQAVLDRIEARGSDTANFAHRGPITYAGPDDVLKRVAATVDGLVLRAGVPIEKPAAGANEYRQVSLSDIAKECLRASGVKVRGMGKDQLIRHGLQQRAAAVGDFPYILAATANKTLRESYALTPSTFELWTNQTSAPDFKEMSRNQLSEAENLTEIPEHGEYTYAKFAESKEVFQIAKHGKLFAITREALVNDDLSAFTRVPQAFAASAKRGLNEAVYAALIANAAMADGNALFSAAHSNYVASGAGAAPGEDTLTAGRVAMRTQTGLNGALINTAPQFLIVPAALETTADKLLNSLADLADNKSSGVVNPFYRKLESVVESYLDASSATGWYLAANPKMIDTVDVSFLGGNDRPYLETKQGWTVDGTEYKVRFEYGIKAIEWRSLYHNYGA